MNRRRYSTPGVICIFTSAIVFIGIGAASITHERAYGKRSTTEAILRFDAKHYNEIVVSGYAYDPERRSVVAFFPLYPIISMLLFATLPIPSLVALMVTANLAFFAASVAFYAYLLNRRPSFIVPKGFDSECGNADADLQSRKASLCSIIAFGMLPTTFFFRMPYSESTFLFFAIISCYAMQRRWPMLCVAVLVGLTTATRPVGIAIIPCFIMYVIDHSKTRREAMFRVACLTPVACWGIVGYMAYQAYQFGDPLAFAKTQEHWRVISNPTAVDKVASLLSLEPIWASYVPGTPYYWGRLDQGSSPFFSLAFFNPMYFVSAIALVAIGAKMQWLNKQEVMLSVLLIAIPYVTRGYEWGMLSQARFVSVVFPSYIVIGEILSRVPVWALCITFAVCGLMLAVYAALFASGRPFI